MTALTVFLTSTNDTLLTTSRQLLTTSGTVTTVSSGQFAKSGTGWSELFSQGGNATLAGTEPSPSGHGFLFDVTTLEGQRVAAGTWTASVLLGAVATGFTVTPVMRIFKRSSAGVYTQFTNGGVAQDLTASSRALTTSQVAATFSQALDSMDFATGDKLYIDVLVNITTGSSNNTAANRVINLSENGGAGEEAVTPGYAPTPVAVSSADTGHGTDTPLTHWISSADGARAREGAYGFGGDWVRAAEAGSATPAGIAKSSSDTASAADSPKPVTARGADSGHGAEAGSVHAALSSPDSGHAVEGSPARVSLSAADSGHGAEAGSVHVSLSKGDTGHGADAVAELRVPGAETGHGTEAGSVHATLAGSDAGHALEGSAVRVSSADSGHVLESSSIHASMAKGDAGYAAEGQQPRVLGADTGHGLEGTPSVRVSSADSGHGAELGQVPGSPSGSDAGHGTEAGSVHVSLSGSDAGHGTDVTPDRWLSGSDAGHGLEGTPRVRVAGADTAHGTEAGSLAVQAHGADAGHGTEGAAPVTVKAADSGHAAESPGVHASLARGDTSHAADAGSVHAVLSSADAATAAESGSTGHTVRGTDFVLATESAFYYHASPDTGRGLEGSVTGVSGADSGHAAERALTAWPGSADASRKAAEAARWSGPLASADAAHLAEGTRPFPFSSADSGVTLEVLHEMGIWTYIPVNVRLAGRFWRVTGRDEHGREVVLLEAERLSGDLLTFAERVRRGTARKLSSADSAHAAERVTREPVGVTCWVQPAVAVSVSVSAVPAALYPISRLCLWPFTTTPRRRSPPAAPRRRWRAPRRAGRSPRPGSPGSRCRSPGRSMSRTRR